MKSTALTKADVEIPVFHQPRHVSVQLVRGVPSLVIHWTDNAMSFVELDHATMQGMYRSLCDINGYD